MNKLVQLYCDVDDFCNVFIPQWQQQLLEDSTQKRQRNGHMTTNELMTIVVGFHMSPSYWHSTSSAKSAALSAILLAPQLGQNPRR
jgi:cytochrome b561